MRLKLKIRRIDKSLPIPQHQTAGSVGVDLYSRINAQIQPKELKILPSNITVEIPRGYMFMVALRPSAAKKYNLFVPHSVGIIDQDYCGEKDEVLLPLYNFGDHPAQIKKGERICQGMYIRVDQVDFTETGSIISDKSRGSYGSTNK